MATSQTQLTNHLYIALFLLENLSSACYFASVCAVISLLKFFEVQVKDLKCESVKTSDLYVDIILGTRILG